MWGWVLISCHRWFWTIDTQLCLWSEPITALLKLTMISSETLSSDRWEQNSLMCVWVTGTMIVSQSHLLWKVRDRQQLLMIWERLQQSGRFHSPNEWPIPAISLSHRPNHQSATTKYPNHQSATTKYPQPLSYNQIILLPSLVSLSR